MGLKYCGQHGYYNNDNFCPHCGKRNIEYPYCKCGEQLITPSADFCPHCGEKRPDNQERGK